MPKTGYMFLFARERKVARKPPPVETTATTTAAQKRRAFRSAVHLPVTFIVQTDRRPRRRFGIMQDISSGGVRLTANRAFPAGTPVELRFTLPNEFLAAFAVDVIERESSPFGDRLRRVHKTVRDFEAMALQGTIIRTTPEAEKFALAIRFTDIDRRTEEEIARFNHYWQLWQVRKLKEAQEQSG